MSLTELSEYPPLQPNTIKYTHQQLTSASDPETIQQLATIILLHLKSTQNQLFEEALTLALTIISKGYANLLL